MSFLKITVQEGFTQHKTDYDLFIAGKDGNGNEVCYGDWYFSGMTKKVACIVDHLHKSIIAEHVAYDEKLVRAMAEYAVDSKSISYWSSEDILKNWNLLNDAYIISEQY